MGEQYQGGSLAGYWMVASVAISFGATAIGQSFFLRPALEPPSKTIVKPELENAPPEDHVTEEAELATVCGDPTS